MLKIMTSLIMTRYLMARYTPYNIMQSSLSVTCYRSAVFYGYSVFSTN